MLICLSDWLLDSIPHFLNSYWLLAAVSLYLLSPLPAPFHVHARDQQARPRLETVWSLSEIDNNWRWSFNWHLFSQFLEEDAGWKWIFIPRATPRKRLRQKESPC